MASDDEHDADSLFERAAQRLARQDAPVAPASPTASPRPDGAVDDPARDEASAPASSTPRKAPEAPLSNAEPPSPGSPEIRSTPSELLDLEPLTEQGYLSLGSSDSELGHEYRRIKRPLLVRAASPTQTDGPPRNIIMVTSSIADEGKTFVALNLAISIAAEVDNTVLLIDADGARAGLSKLTGVGRAEGLSDFLAGRCGDLSDILHRTSIRNLRIIPAGTSSPHLDELFASERMRELMDDVAARYDDRIVILDTGPLLQTSEPSVLARLAGQVLYVVQADSTSETQVLDGLAMLPSADAVSLVLNKASRKAASGGYGYGYAR